MNEEYNINQNMQDVTERQVNQHINQNEADYQTL
jgi:hypothetical protein